MEINGTVAAVGIKDSFKDNQHISYPKELCTFSAIPMLAIHSIKQLGF